MTNPKNLPVTFLYHMNDVHMNHLHFPKAPKRLAQKFHFTILRIEVTCVSHGLSAIAELLVLHAKSLLIRSHDNKTAVYTLRELTRLKMNLASTRPLLSTTGLRRCSLPF